MIPKKLTTDRINMGDYYASFEYKLLACPICGKDFVNAYDKLTGKISPYLWKPDCDCLDKSFRVSIG
jgi:anaerobic ribonucleoside-triphosphate reductase